MKTSKELADETGKRHGAIRCMLQKLKADGFIQYYSEEEVKVVEGKGRKQRIISLSEADYERVKKRIGYKKSNTLKRFSTKTSAFNAYKTSRQLAIEIGMMNSGAVALIRRVVSKGWLPEHMFADDLYEKRGHIYREIAIKFQAYEWLLDYAKGGAVTAMSNEEIVK
jgi:hypothetical protein